MIPVDRYVSYLTGKPVDRPPLLEESPWALTAEYWRQQGMPEGVPPYLQECDPLERTRTDLWMLPRFEEKILAEDERSITQITDRGEVQRIMKPIGSGMPLHIRHPVQTRADWEALKLRLQPDSGDRFRPDWDESCARWQSEGTTVVFGGTGRSPSLFGYARELMGAESILLALYDDPGLVEDIMDTSADLTIAMVGRTAERFPVRAMYFWEDMAYRAGPLISPAMFRRFMTPRYRRMCDYARSRGIEIILVDSDGDIRQLIPLWLDAGLDGVYPLEVQAGMDVVALRKQYGDALVMKGGIDKRALAHGPAAIDAELERTMPVMEQGRYIPSLDHAVPPDVPYANMLYYWEKKKRMMGL